MEQIRVDLPYGRGIPQHVEYTPIKMETGQSDDRKYGSMLLENGLRVLLVHDPSTAYAAAAMNVGVGYFDDPDNTPGLAHLCEHVLPRSSTKYKDHFFKFIRNNAGSVNSFTFASSTSYYFSVNAGIGCFKEAVERFGACFQDIEFLDDCVISELSAVNEEYEMNSESDFHRIFQLFKTRALPEHPWGKFGIGNKKSLTQAMKDDATLGKKLASALQEWWQTHYSASIMGLVILSRDSLESLARLVKHNFLGIPTLNTSPPVATIPWGAKQQRCITFAKTLKNNSTIEVSFCLPDQDRFYESKPTTFVSRIIQHQGPGSLDSYLKGKGWITRLFCDPYQPARGFSFFSIKAELTSKGLIRYQSVLEAIYACLYLLPWAINPASGLFEEFKTIQNARFDYSEKSEAKCSVNHLSNLLLTQWPRERLVKGPTGIWKQDESALRTLLGVYLAPEAGSVLLSSNSLSSIGIDGPWMTERWYGVQYMEDRLNPEVFQNAKAPNIIQCISLPNSNRFIPTDFSVKSPNLRISNLSQPDDPTIPHLPWDGIALEPLRKSDKSTLWFKQDVQSLLPKGYIGVYIRSPVARRSSLDDNSATNTVMTQLIELIVRNALLVEFYDALEAGSRFALIYDDGNLILQTSGYTDRMLSLLEHLLRRIKSYVIPEQSFWTYKEELKQSFQNDQLDSPLLLSHRIVRYGLRNFEWTAEEMEAVLDDPNLVTLEKLQDHLTNLLAPTWTKILVTGNFDEHDAISAQGIVDAVVGSTNDPDTDDVVTRIPNHRNWVYFYSVANKEEKDNAVGYYLQVTNTFGSNPTKLHAALLLFAILVNYPFYEKLRMEEKLGYDIISAPLIQKSVVGMLFTVQSHQSTNAIESKIDDFLKGFKKDLRHMVISEAKTTLVKKLEERAENMEKRAAELATFILGGGGAGCCTPLFRHPWGPNIRQLRKHGSKEEELIHAIKRLHLKDILDFYDEYIHPASPSRAKLSVHAQPTPPVDLKTTESHYNVIHDLKQFKQEQDADEA